MSDKRIQVAILGVERSKTGRGKFFLNERAWEDWPAGDYVLWAVPPKHVVSKKCWCKPATLAEK